MGETWAVLKDLPVRLIDILDDTVRDSLLADTRYREPRIQHMLLPFQC